MKKFQELLKDEYEDFESLKTRRNRIMCYIGSELWESKFDGLLI